MNFSSENSSDLQYLKKRLELAVKENDLLRKENQSQRKELQSLKTTFTNIVQDQRAKTAAPNGKSANPAPLADRFQNEQALRQILEMQRKRLDEVEKEHEQLKQKYEKSLFQQKNEQPIQSYSQSLSSRYADESGDLYEARQKNKELETRLKDMATAYAKEIAGYKQRLAQQDAELILNRNMDHSFSKSFDQSYQPIKSISQTQDNSYPKPVQSRDPQMSANSQKQLEPLQNGNQYRIIKQFSLNKKQ